MSIKSFIFNRIFSSIIKKGGATWLTVIAAAVAFAAAALTGADGAEYAGYVLDTVCKDHE